MDTVAYVTYMWLFAAPNYKNSSSSSQGSSSFFRSVRDFIETRYKDMKQVGPNALYNGIPSTTTKSLSELLEVLI